MFPKYINTNVFANQGILLIHYESLPNNGSFIINNLKTNFEKVVLFSTQNNNALFIPDLSEFVSTNRIALVLCDEDRTVLALHSLCVYVGSFYNYSFNLPDFYCFVYEINYPISRCIVNNYTFFEKEKTVSNNKNHLYTPFFESINNRITKYYIKNTSNGNTKELPTSTINAEVIASNQKDCDECFDIEREPKQVSEIIDTNTTPFTYFPTLDLQFDIPTKLSTASELDLITKISESDDARRKQYYVQHIKTSAESLMITPQTFSANVNLKPKQIKIIEENKKRHEAEKLKKDNEYMRKLYVKYKNGDDDTKLQIITKKYNEYITNRIQLLSLEFYYNQWILENRKKEIDESLLLDVYKTCLYVVENGTEKERDYAMEKLREVGFDNTVDELKYKIENNLHKENKQSSEKGKRSDDKQKKRDMSKKERIENESTDTDKENKTNDKLPYKVRDKDLYFQLKYAGHYLKRSTESRPDSRVNFTPDGWQIKLLDSVDNNNSSIICAPTSSGKTFICYYAIEKVLKGAETDVVIFCLPTKALVNQVMADIYARFSTKTYKHKALQGILMKDYQVDPWKSQILILTPLMLETLLSSLHKMESNKKHKKNVNKEAEKQDTSFDALAAMVGSLNVNDNTLINNIKKNNFTLSNIKYIIIDEVHMICTKEMGTQIQRIVHMSPSPLLLLSATLGNLDIFYKWMESIENSKGRKCELVQYKERYCEIRNYVYHKEEIVEEVIGDSTSDEDHCMEYKAPTLLSDNKDEETESGKVKEEKEKKREVTHRIEPTITPINPLFGYSVESLVNNNFSVELTLLPDQLLDIFYTMYDVSRDKRVTKGLRPQSFFKSNIITKKDVKDYQLYMFETIKEFYRDSTITHEQLNEIYNKLVSNSNSAFESAEKEMKKYRKELAKTETNDIVVEKLDAGDDNKQNIMQNHIPIEYNNDSDNENSKDLLNNPLMKDVKSMDNLTHIDTSSYDLQYMLDNITDLVLLLKKQDLLPCIIFNTDRSICDLLAEKVYADLEEMERREAKVVKKKKEYKRPKEILKKDEWIEDTLYEEENIKDIVNYRVDPKFCLFNTLYRKSDYELADVYKVTESMFYRGIGVHHNGKNKKTRLAVETLFRAKHVACVFSTETLSLGINMPCKTVVFAGDYKLSVVEYKQMAGRAGRRGFDLMGNVVFFGMNKIKARNLMMSEVSNMRVNSELMCNTSLIGNDAMRNSILKDSLFEINYGGNALQFNKPCVVYGEKGDKTNGDTENTESVCESKNDSTRLTSVQECVKTKYINSTGRKDALSDYLNKFDRCEYTLCPTCHKESNEEMMSNDLNLYDAFSNPKFRYLIFDIQKEILLKHNIVKNNEKQLNREDEIEKRVNITNDLIGRKMLSLITLGGKEYIIDHEFKIKNDLSLTKFADILISGKEQDPQMLSFIIFLQYLSSKKIPITEPKDLIFYIAHFFEVIPTVDQNNALKEFTMPDFVRYINTLYYDSMALLFNSKLTKIQNKSTDFLFNLYIFPSFDLKMKNSYLIDFFEHGKVEAIRKNNNIGIKTLWASCYVVDSLLEKLNESGDKTVKATYELFHNKFKKIFA